jgi:hypothetical protein
MTFEEMYNKYLINSSVSYEQARFIWNASIDEILLTSEIYKIPVTTTDYFNIEIKQDG